MLEQILTLIGTGRSWSIEELAVTLRVSKEMVLSAVDFLERQGQIRRIRMGGCSGSCGSCHGCGDLELLGSLPMMWEVQK